MSFNSKKYYGDKYEKNKQYLRVLLKTIKNQTYKNLEIFVVDDCSDEDPTPDIRIIFPDAKIIRNEENIGLLKSENKAIRMAKGEYIALLNQDLYLENDYIERLVKIMEQDHKIAVSSGKSLNFYLDDKNETCFTKLFDSAGMLFFKDRNVIERGRLEKDNKQYDSQKEVFGITGAAPFFRKSAFEDIAVEGEYYDEDFWMYKDDVDLCWRFNLRGWKCMYCPQTIAYHARTASGIAKKYRKNFLVRRLGYIVHRIIKREGGSTKVRRRDFCNHYLMLVKNDSWQSIFRSIAPFLWREAQKFIFGCFFEPNVYFPGWVDFFRKLGKIKKKRKIIQSRRTIGWREMEGKFEKGIW